MPIKHVIVIRERDHQIVLSASDVTITDKEQVEWVHENGKPFEIDFEGDDCNPFGTHRAYQSSRGRLDVGNPHVPACDKGKAPKKGKYVALPFKYTVKVEGCPDLDPKIVFEVPPDDGRE